MFEPACFETIVAAVPNARSEVFAQPRLPPLMELAPAVAAAELARADPAAWDETALDLAGRVVSLLAGPTTAPPVQRDERRIAAAVRRIETAAQLPLSLADLAGEAAMSRYHFLRTFRQVVGMTPHQFILRTRLHTAAIELRRSGRPVLDIALDAGFADLSTFNRRFRATMGVTPSRYRGRG
jgi:AraC-like DNA-binding protein